MIKKLLLFLGFCLLLACLALGAAYYAGMRLLEYGVEQAKNQLAQSENPDLPLTVDYEEASFLSPIGISLKGLQAELGSPENELKLKLRAESFNTRFTGVLKGDLELNAHGIRIEPATPELALLNQQYRVQHIEVDWMQYQLPIEITNLEEAMRALEAQVNGLLKEGTAAGSIEATGTVWFSIAQRQLPQRFFIRNQGDISSISLDRSDLESVGPLFADRLSGGDLDLVARHPMLAPQLLEIRKDTEQEVREARWDNHSIPEDAYRHVLWSYLLVQEFGADFAEQVTEAHETDSFNSDSEQARDRHNNSLGIEYAQQGIPRSKLLHLVLTDPRVQR